MEEKKNKRDHDYHGIEMAIIQTILFEFENTKNTFVCENLEISLKEKCTKCKKLNIQPLG